MKRLPVAILLVSLALFSVTGDTLATEGMPDKKEAILAALNVLQTVDEQDYEKSWEMLAPIFRERTNKTGWLKDFPHMRGNYGALISRQVQFVKEIVPPKGAPQADYLFILFASKFEIKSAVETVTMMQQPGGIWQMAGYNIK